MRLTLLACLSLLCVAVAGAIMQERDQIVCVVKLLRSPASNKAEEMLLAELEKWIRMWKLRTKDVDAVPSLQGLITKANHQNRRPRAGDRSEVGSTKEGPLAEHLQELANLVYAFWCLKEEQRLRCQETVTRIFDRAPTLPSRDYLVNLRNQAIRRRVQAEDAIRAVASYRLDWEIERANKACAIQGLTVLIGLVAREETGLRSVDDSTAPPPLSDEDPSAGLNQAQMQGPRLPSSVTNLLEGVGKALSRAQQQPQHRPGKMFGGWSRMPAMAVL